VGIAVGTCGAAGLAYALITVHRARRQTQYTPVLEDWLWHGVFPVLAYTAMGIAAAFLSRDPAPSLFVVAGAVLSLVLIGIHNAWDTVTYLAFLQQEPQNPNQR
jgi:hypothetical protein